MDVFSLLFVTFRSLLILLTIVLVCLYYYSTWTHDYWKKRGIPYEKPIPFVGNLQYMLRKSFWDLFLELYKKHQNADYLGIFMTRTPVFVVQTPELTKKVLVKDFDHFTDRYVYSGYSDPLGALNIFCAKNPLWGNVRRELTPMFTASKLRMLTELMNKNAGELVKRIDRMHVQGKHALDLKELFSMYASDTVGFTVFGLRISILADKLSPLWYITNHMVKWKFWRGLEFTLIMFVPAMAKLLRLQFFSSAATEYIKKLFWSVVKERTEKGSLHSQKDLVNLLLKIKENPKLNEGDKAIQMSDDVMMAQAAVFILGAIETSSTTLSFCCHELAHNPDIQEKLYMELKDAHDKNEQKILEYDDLLEIKYLTNCIYETLRKYPPVAFLDRTCNKDYKVDENVTITKGVPVYINVMALQYSEKYYPEPEKWLPNRFSGEPDTDNRQFTFLPFGDGPRFCIGKRYGMMQVRAAVAHIILSYRLEPAGPYHVEKDPYAVFLSPKNGPYVNFIPR